MGPPTVHCLLADLMKSERWHGEQLLHFLQRLNDGQRLQGAQRFAKAAPATVKGGRDAS